MFSEEHANRAVRFIENLKHVKGHWNSHKIELLDWQKNEIIRPLFGTLNADGTRQYRTCYVILPRKNGKTSLAATIALYLLMADGEVGGEIYSAAADTDQASLCFDIAAQMIRIDPILEKRFTIKDSVKRIIDYKTGSYYRAISADSKTKHGFNAHGVLFDELHVQPNRDLWDVLKTSTGSRKQPLIFAITTAGYDKNSICWELHEYALKVKNGIIEDKTFLPVIYAADETDDWTAEETWKKANPSLGETISIDFLRQECEVAKETPAYENTFKRLYLNIWTSQETRWVSLDKWDACGGIVDAEKLKGRLCYAGLDLSTTYDITAFVLVFPPVEEGEKTKVLAKFWIPQDNMEERIRKDKVNYDVWVRQGFIKATEGNVIDYRTVRNDIVNLGVDYNIAEIAYDRWGATQIAQDLTDEGFEMIQMGQGFASMSGPTKELEGMILSQGLNHGGNPVLTWMFDNVTVKQDPAGNIKPVKPDRMRTGNRIDGVVALIMGVDRTIRNSQAPSVYATRGLITI